MNSLMRTFAHNAWANRRVFDGLRHLAGPFLDREGRPGDRTNREKLQHLVLVERGFQDAIVGNTRMPEAPADLEGLIAYAEETASRFARLLESPVELERQVDIPWWSRSFTVGDCLTQVISHTAQHRAELAWELAREGVDTGELDYIVWFAQQNTA
jgi:uncharacterized damage-inducible protein DinB